jgi:hypothetical protein
MEKRSGKMMMAIVFSGREGNSSLTTGFLWEILDRMLYFSQIRMSGL